MARYIPSSGIRAQSGYAARLQGYNPRVTPGTPGMSEDYAESEGKDNTGNYMQAGGRGLGAIAPYTGPFAPYVAGAGVLLSTGGMVINMFKKPSQNKEMTAMVKRETDRLILNLRSGNYDVAFGTFDALLGHVLKSNSFKKALIATNPDAWGQIGFMKEQVQKLYHGDLSGDPAGQLINSISDFMADTIEAEKVNPYVGKMREAFGGVLNYVTDEVQYTPYGRESYEQVKDELPQMVGGKGKESLPDEIQDVLKWEPQFNRGRFDLPEDVRARGGRFAPPETFVRGEPAPIDFPPEDKPKEPLTQQQYYDRSLGLANYRGEPRYPEGYDPNVHGSRIEPYRQETTPQAPAGIQVERRDNVLPGSTIQPPAPMQPTASLQTGPSRFNPEALDQGLVEFMSKIKRLGGGRPPQDSAGPMPTTPPPVPGLTPVQQARPQLTALRGSMPPPQQPMGGKGLPPYTPGGYDPLSRLRNSLRLRA